MTKSSTARRYRASKTPLTPARDPSTIRPDSRGTLLIGILLGLILTALGVYLLTSVFLSNGRRSYWRVLVASLLGRSIFEVLEEEIGQAIER